MQNTKTRAIVALAAIAAIGAGAASQSGYRDLRASRADAAAAWQAIGAIHAAREQAAAATLAQVGPHAGLDVAGVDQARSMLSQVQALPASPQLLDDPQAIDTYKRYQGQLAGALFGLAFNARTPAGAAALENLRASLVRNESALAEARQRYRAAAGKHNALASSMPRAVIARVTGTGAVPSEL